MQKKYVVRLTDQERVELQGVVRKLKGTSQKVKRAQILLKADFEGPGWTDLQIAQAFDCRVQTVEDVRRRLVGTRLRGNAQQSEASSQADAEDSGRTAGSVSDRHAFEKSGQAHSAKGRLHRDAVADGIFRGEPEVDHGKLDRFYRG
jgi:hypothetical protein